jgi:pSer/pThr/pTyr-binding forkhead associated (FHA) protein
MAKVSLKYKDSVLDEISLDKDEITIGRKPGNDIHIDNAAVSGLHAKIIKDAEGNYFIEDQNSTNGTLVNGNRISKIQLNNGDDIIVGKHDLVFQKEAGDIVAPTPKAVPTSDQTMMLDEKVQDDIIRKAMESAPAAEAKELQGGFMVIEGNLDKKQYELTESMSSIGKDKNAAIPLKGFFTPKLIAIVHKKRDGYYIDAANASKPPQINGKKIAGRHKLKDGDTVQVTKVKLKFYLS